MAKGYRLVAEDVPPIVRATVYEEALRDFASSPAPSVRVEISKKKPSTIYMGLLKAKKSDPAYESISVSKRDARIYLLKK